MAEIPITQEEIDAVFPKVAETMADALGCDVEDIKPDVSLIEGLDAESIDFLDMVFRLERAFKIKIPRGKIVENARGDLPEAEFEQKGIVTEKGLAQLREYLSEVPAERFKTPMKVADIPRLFTPRRSASSWSARRRKRLRGLARVAFVAQRGQLRIDGARVRSFRRVLVRRPHHRVRARDARARRRSRSRAAIAAFPACLVAEAVGQLAAWVAMDAHRLSRPAGRGARHRDAFRRRRRSPDSSLDLDVDILTCDDDAVAYNGRAQRRRPAT